MTLSPHHHFISTKSLVRSLSAIPDKCAIVCWYPRLLGTIPLLLGVVVNAHVCCVLRKISNIMKKIWCFPINFPSCPDKKYRSSVWSWYLICPFCPGNLILSRFAGQPMRNVAELARAVRQGGWEVVKAFWRAFDDLPYCGKMEDLVKLGFSWIFPNRSGGFRWSTDSGNKHT